MTSFGWAVLVIYFKTTLSIKTLAKNKICKGKNVKKWKRNWINLKNIHSRTLKLSDCLESLRTNAITLSRILINQGYQIVYIIWPKIIQQLYNNIWMVCISLLLECLETPDSVERVAEDVFSHNNQLRQSLILLCNKSFQVEIL